MTFVSVAQKQQRPLVLWVATPLNKGQKTPKHNTTEPHTNRATQTVNAHNDKKIFSGRCVRCGVCVCVCERLVGVYVCVYVCEVGVNVGRRDCSDVTLLTYPVPYYSLK